MRKLPKYNQDEIAGMCGVNYLSDFGDREEEGRAGREEWWGSQSDYRDSIGAVKLGQAGLVLAAFVEGDEMGEKAFKQLKKKFNLVYESSWRKNNNTGNMFKLCVYDGLVKKESK